MAGTCDASWRQFTLGYLPAMPRRPRLHVPGGIYHVVLRGNHRQPIFHEDSDRDLFEHLLADSLNRDGCEVHSYCWMTNHIHLVVRIGESLLGRFVQHFASRYARVVQRRVPTTGHLFERRYRATLVTRDSYLMALIRYVHLNPVRAGMVADPSNYRWSSHRAYLGQTRVPWLNADFCLGLFGTVPARARRAYQRFMATTPDADEDLLIRTGTESSDPGKKQKAPAYARQATTVLDRRLRLETLIAGMAARLGVPVRDLATASRARHLSYARAVIAHEALSAKLATLSEMAERFNRSPATLWVGMQRHVHDACNMR